MPFPASTSRLILRDPGGSRIVLDAREAVIRIYGPPPTNALLFELDADQDFFGVPLVVMKIYDVLGILRTQMSGLQLFIAGDDGRVEMKAGSSGTDNSQAQITMLPAGAAADGRVKGQAEANGGASLTIDSPSYSTHDQSQIVLYAENNTDPSHVDINAGVMLVNGDQINTGALDVATTVDVGTALTIGTTVDINGKEHGFGYADAAGAPSDTCTNASFEVIAGAATDTYVKERANTRSELTMHHSAFSGGAANTEIDIGLRFNAGAGDTDILVGHMELNAANDRKTVSGIVTHTGLAAASYTVTPIWRRPAGTGTLTSNADDRTSFVVKEVRQA